MTALMLIGALVGFVAVVTVVDSLTRDRRCVNCWVREVVEGMERDWVKQFKKNGR